MTREQELEAALLELMTAIERQLAGTGKGIEPSPRVAEAIDAGRKLLAPRPPA